jgi:hypothetical protein
MMPGNNVAMLIMIMVEAGSEGPLDANDKSFKPSNKKQHNRFGHSTKECER